jgi:tellurite resistance protein TehA-like permease
MVMATGIVSAALHQAGWPGPAQVLLGGAAACFVVIAVAVGWRALRDPAGLRAELGQPQRAFTAFAAVAACGVLGNGLAAEGQQAARAAAAVLAGVASLLWLALTGRILARLGGWARDRMPIAGVNGTWYLWAVGTQSLAIAAAFLYADGLLAARPAAVAGAAVWAAGLVLYLVIMALVAARLLRAGLGPADATAPYWVAMGAASISAFAAARIAPAAAAGLPAARPVLTGGGVAAWLLATWLIPALAALTVGRLPRPVRLRYGSTAWMAVFPLGMYAMAGMVLGAAARLPLVHHIGAVAVWPAAAAWALTTVALATTLGRRRGGRAEPGATAPVSATHGTETAQVTT